MSKKLAGVSLVLLVGTLAYYFGFSLGIDNSDLNEAVHGWFDQLVARGLPAISGEYSNYTPSYLYLLWVASLAAGTFSYATLIKLVSLFFMGLASLMVLLILRQMGKKPETSVMAAMLFLCLPTVVVNGIYWGQCDIIYASLLLVFFLFSLREAPVAATIAFGAALAFKAQAIFMAPYLLFLVFMREVPVRYLILVPITYLVMMIPAAIAGRPWLDLALVYANQAQTYHSLSLNAPNPYVLLRHVLDYNTSVPAGIVLSAFVGLAIAIGGLWLTQSPENKLVIATSSALLLPFILPKMHDRYFFLADVFSFLLAFFVRNGWLVAVLVQLASLFAYTAFLFGFGPGPLIGAELMIGAVVVMLLIFVHQATIGRVSLGQRLTETPR